MSKKDFWIYIGILIFILAGTLTGIIKSCSMISNLNAQVEQLKSRNNALVMDYANDQRIIDDLKFEITGLNQEIENLQIQNASNDLFINALESKVVDAEMEYQQALSYISMAEWILDRQGVQYFYTGRR